MPTGGCAAIKSVNKSVSYIETLPLATASMRSKPAPVSIALRGRSRELAVGAAIVLLEHDVPDLDEAVAFVRPVVVGTGRVRGAGVVEDLGARAARAGRAHRPEVVFVPARDARGVEPDLASPRCRCASSSEVCTVTYSLRGIELHNVGEKLPREADRLGLVVVAEREVAEHLEERAVPSGAADVLDVRSSRRRRAGSAAP